jgi:RHS repeat-associated protein
LLVQETHYDPWGLELTGLGYQYGGIKVNKYLYNGKELLDDQNLGLYDYGQRMYDPTIGRFNRIDRFSEKYNSLSPYQYGANNPVLYIDVNGDSIMISHRGERIVYQDGNLTWAGTGQTYDGKAFNKKGDLKGFVGQSVKALNAIRTGGKSGNELISNLQNDSRYTKISKGDNSATGISVSWDPNSTSGGLDESGGTSRPAFIGLAHELGHAWDLLEDGKQDQSEWFTAPNGQVKPKAEQYASHWENLIRAENGLNLRTHYATTSYEPSRLVNGVSSLHQSQQYNFSFPISGFGRANLYFPKRRINITVSSPYNYR